MTHACAELLGGFWTALRPAVKAEMLLLGSILDDQAPLDLQSKVKVPFSHVSSSFRTESSEVEHPIITIVTIISIVRLLLL